MGKLSSSRPPLTRAMIVGTPRPAAIHFYIHKDVTKRGGGDGCLMVGSLADPTPGTWRTHRHACRAPARTCLQRLPSHAVATFSLLQYVLYVNQCTPDAHDAARPPRGPSSTSAFLRVLFIGRRRYRSTTQSSSGNYPARSMAPAQRHDCIRCEI